MDPSTAAAWRDLYIGMVGAGASLTGLTFVAIALDPHQIEGGVDPGGVEPPTF